jgi:hypothetical protein
MVVIRTIRQLPPLPAAEHAAISGIASRTRLLFIHQQPSVTWFVIEEQNGQHQLYINQAGTEVNT